MIFNVNAHSGYLSFYGLYLYRTSLDYKSCHILVFTKDSNDLNNLDVKMMFKNLIGVYPDSYKIVLNFELACSIEIDYKFYKKNIRKINNKNKVYAFTNSNSNYVYKNVLQTYVMYIGNVTMISALYDEKFNLLSNNYYTEHNYSAFDKCHVVLR